MATNVQPVQLSAEIRRLLAGLRWRIRAYVLLEGLLLAVVWVAMTFIAEVSIDYGLVLVGASELPWLVRLLALVVVSSVLAYIVWRWILRRAFVRLADHSMAVLLERRFISFHDSLVTAVEMAEHPDHAQQFNLEMLAHTTGEARSEVDRVRLARVFNLFPLVFSGLLALALATPIGLYAGFFTPHFLQGVERVYLLSNEPWPRRTNIEVLGVDVIHASTRTGEIRTQRLAFKDKVLHVAKGANLELHVAAHGDGYQKPEWIEMYYWSDEGSDRVRMTRVSASGELGDDVHLYAEKPLRGVLSTVQFDVRGADHRLDGYRIEVVDSPVIVGVDMHCVFPRYMVDEKLSLGLPRTIALTPGASLPMGTQVTLRALSNKPLKDARVVDGQSREELRPVIYRRVPLLDEATGKAVNVTIALPPLRKRVTYSRPGSASGPQEETVAVSFDEPAPVFDRATGKRISVLAVDKRFYLVDAKSGKRTPLDKPLAVQVEVAALGTDQKTNRVDGMLQPEVKHRPRIEVPVAALNADLMLDIHLQDEDDVLSQDPHRLFVSATADTAPQVDVVLRGIGTVVTPNVRIPMAGKVTDDYGVAGAWFEVERNGSPLLREDIALGEAGKIEAALDFKEKRERQPQDGRVELSPEDALVVTVRAEDRYDLADQPNVGGGDRYQLKVVTEDQLLAYLARQEQTMREILEHAREEMEREHDALLRSKSPDALGAEGASEPGEAGAEPDDQPAAVDNRSPAEKVQGRRLLRVQQALSQSGKSRQEVRGVAEGFASIREELINNRVDAKDHMDRLQNDVYQPLVYIADDMFTELDRRLKQLEEQVEKPDEFVASSDGAIKQVEDILVEIDKVLVKLEKFEGYNELVELLRGLINEQQGLIDETKSEQTRSVLKELEDLSN
jgi:hypothetical protein